MLSGERSAANIRMLLERCCTSTPVRRTSSGRRGSATLTRLFTAIRAVSGLVPTSKVAVMLTVPLEVLWEL